MSKIETEAIALINGRSSLPGQTTRARARVDDDSEKNLTNHRLPRRLFSINYLVEFTEENK